MSAFDNPDKGHALAEKRSAPAAFDQPEPNHALIRVQRARQVWCAQVNTTDVRVIGQSKGIGGLDAGFSFKQGFHCKVPSRIVSQELTVASPVAIA